MIESNGKYKKNDIIAVKIFNRLKEEQDRKLIKEFYGTEDSAYLVSYVGEYLDRGA